jgi:GntR family transcriptional regulator/MocR family aminotransferase
VVARNGHLKSLRMTTIVARVRRTTPGILPLITVDRSSAKPFYRQLYEGYRDAIVARLLRAGQRMPSTRTLASDLGISRIPVLNAFEQLLAEGYFESRVGAGTFVAGSLPDELATPTRPEPSRKIKDRKTPRALSRRVRDLEQEGPGPWLRNLGLFSVSQPPTDHFPLKIWSRLVARRSRDLDPSQLHYSQSMGYLPFREAVAEYLRTSRAVACEAQQIMVVNGSQHALELTALVLLDPDQSAWIEDPGYFGAKKALRMAGVRAAPVPVDDEGLDVEAGMRLHPRARAAYVTPSHQFPLGVTMSASRRLQLLDWAQGSGAWIIEDDYDSEYRFGSQPISSLQGLDRDRRVIYIGTLTKILFPALRVGYIVIPEDLVEAFATVRRAMDFFSPTFHQVVLADFIREGHLSRHARRMRQLCEGRRSALVEAIRSELGDGLEVLGDRAGMFLAAALPKGSRDLPIAEEAARGGLWATPLSQCSIGRPRRQGLVLGYGGFNETEIRSGVRRLRRAFETASVSRAQSTDRPTRARQTFR